MTNDLLPCPFCGTADLRTIWTDFGVDDTPVHVSIACNECLAELPPCLTEDQAIAAWNTRANKPAEVDGDTSDGYHTFNELYEHRHALFAALLRCYPTEAWKSKKHDDGSMFDGWFIAGIHTPEGNATYHIPMRLWDTFEAHEVDTAPKWDGHTPADVITRIGHLATGNGGGDVCQHCNGEGGEVEQNLMCCGNGSLHGCCDNPISQEYFHTCPACGGSGKSDQQKTAEPCGDAVAWQVYNELVKEWTSAYADKVKADQLVKDGYKIRPLYAEQQPAAPTQIDAVELENALEYLNNPTFDDECEEWGRCWLIVEAAARAHLEKSKGGV